MPVPQRLLFVVNDPGFFLSHRLPIALAARSGGYEVAVATAPGAASIDIEAHGLRHFSIPLARSSSNPIREFRSLLSVIGVMRRFRPDIVHLVTVKPVIYGGLAARLTRVPAVVAAVSGLGTVFIAKGGRASLLRWAVARLYRLAFGHRNIRVIFQNENDRTVLMNVAALARDNAVVIRGSGVDVRGFQVQPEPAGAPTVVMASRLLWDKGVREYAEAARIVRAKHPGVSFLLAGDMDPGNRTSLTPADCSRIESEGAVTLVGHQRDVAALFAAATIVVLPSYREGLPKVLLEAAAAGRAVVTTDVPGCRDAIERGVTGLLVPDRDAGSLAAAIEQLIEDAPRRRAMGTAARQLAEREFNIDEVVRRHLEIYAELGAQVPRQAG